MPVLVSNLQEKKVLSDQQIALVKAAVGLVLAEEGYHPQAEVSVVFVDDGKICELNRQYRQVDRPTDVLSFAMLEGDPLPGEDGGPVLGDIVISLEAAMRQANEYGHGVHREIAYLVVHGMLHLLGDSHEQEEDRRIMREKEKKIMDKLGLPR